MIQKLQAWYSQPNKSTLAKYFRYFIEIFFILTVAFLIRTIGFGLYQVPSGSMETTLLAGERFFADKLTYWFRAPKRGEIIAFNAPDKSVAEQGYAYSNEPIKNLFERYVYGPANWTKRIIGIPGDHIQGKIENNHPFIYLNEIKLDEPYLNKYPLVYQKQKDNQILPVTYDPEYAYDKQPFYKIDPQLLLTDKANNPLMTNPGTPLYGNKDIFDVHLKENNYWVMGDNRGGSADSRFWGPLDGSQIHGRIIFRIWSINTNSSWWIFDFLFHPIDFFKNIRWLRCLQSIS